MAAAAGRERSTPRARFVLFAAILAALFALVTVGAALDVVSRGAGAVLLRLLLPGTAYFSFALLLTRNITLAALVALVPLAGATWSVALEAQPGPLGDVTLGAAVGSVLAFVFVDEFGSRIATDADVRGAAVAGLGAIWRPAVGALVAASALAQLVTENHWSWAAARALMSPLAFSVLAALALVPAGSTIVSLNESDIARINRAREWRIRAAFPLTLIAEPRWGLSMSGVGLVVCVVSYFGAEPLVTMDHWISLSTVLASLAVSLVLARDWRKAVGLGFSFAVTGLLGLWAGAHGGGRFYAVGYYEAMAVGFVLMMIVAAHDAASLAGPAALARGLEERAGVIFCATASVLSASALAGHLGLVTAVVVIAGALCSLFLVTAVGSALEAVLPRRKSLAEMYRRPP